MKKYTKSLFVEDVFTVDELNEIINEFDNKPVSHYYEKQKTKNKNLDYDVPGSVVNRIVKPKLGKILGDDDHHFFGGAYKEYEIPFPLHIDNYIPLASMTFEHEPRHETAFLIPLVDGPGLKTAMFDVFLPVGHTFNSINGTDETKLKELEPFLLKEKTDIDMSEFDHIKEPLKSVMPYIPIDRIQEWKLGSIMTWHFDQLHCSTNFQKFSNAKKLMVIMIN